MLLREEPVLSQERASPARRPPQLRASQNRISRPTQQASISHPAERLLHRSVRRPLVVDVRVARLRVDAILQPVPQVLRRHADHRVLRALLTLGEGKRHGKDELIIPGGESEQLVAELGRRTHPRPLVHSPADEIDLRTAENSSYGRVLRREPMRGLHRTALPTRRHTRVTTVDGPVRCAYMLMYNSAVSGNCYKVRLLCAHLGLPLELRELDVVDRSNRPAVIGDLNPALRVPTLILEDGRPLPESNAIITYLAEGTDYLPTDRYDRARALGWMMFEQYEIEPNIAVARFWNLFDVGASPEQHAGKQAAGRKGLEALERGLTGKEWLVGDRYGVADISLYAYTHVAYEGGFDLEEYPWVQAWLGRVASQAGHIKITD